ncbi:adenine deaminase [Pedobacter sp. HMF7647]|uniref:Adenine deaminase n=1 Tax=Hufsiella arboris TaxID=2695275 RepID=A0A7K1Y6N5_9SPHI|nr:adenine deaminase [Hufsiella arboris]MXV50232.1 adenine deaminase [Hufsiella arboris]
MDFSISGNLVDIAQKRIYQATIIVKNQRIERIEKLSDDIDDSHPFILPGFVDAHVHIESSMLVPSEFARLAVVHGTVGTVSDPHEIANVCGMEGVEFMIDNGKTVPFKFNFGAPSCVPATVFETAGAELNPDDVESLLKRDEIKYLSEMMNYPGVLFGDAEVLKKIAAAKKYNKPVDGHAPGLKGDEVRKYIEAGISTDHECFTEVEALEKLQLGMKILIREGSAAKNFEALINLLNDFPDSIMFCSDDKHPDSLVEGHINKLCERAVEKGVDVFKILQAACINPVKHYKLNIGLLQPKDPADFVLVKDLTHFQTLETYIDGLLVAKNGESLINTTEAEPINFFDCKTKKPFDFGVASDLDSKKTLVIEALDGQLITNRLEFELTAKSGYVQTDLENDILKIAVVNRYHDAPAAISFIKNFGLKTGALASSVAHDSHNIVVVGVDDESIAEAVNLIIEAKGGVSCVTGIKNSILPLPVAGLMSTADGYEVAKKYTEIDLMAKECGSTLSSPFMTLSFMALLVIPSLKLSDKGLFDGDKFKLLDDAFAS